MHLSVVVALMMAPHLSPSTPSNATKPQGNGIRGAHASFTWVHTTANLGEMIQTADAIVVASLVATDPGRTIYTSSGDFFVTSEVNRLVVSQALKGATAADVVSVHRNSRYGTMGGETFSILGPDGPYELGIDYLLFLKRAPGTDVYGLVNGEAKYWVGEDERVRPHGEQAAATNGRVSRAIRGRRLPEVVRLIQSVIE